MGILLVLIALGAAAYLFFKSNTKRGVETVRASIYLGGMHAGATVAEANFAANLDVANGPLEIVQGAMALVKADYGGRQLPMIADAYRRGMTPKLPLWYRVIADLRTDNEPSRYSGELSNDTRRDEGTFPRIPEEVGATAAATVEWCREEISAYLGKPTETLPNYGLFHDVNVGSYVCGFLQGQFIVNGHLKRWAGSDTDREYLAYNGLAGACLTQLLGRERAIALIDHLPQIGPAHQTENIRMTDIAGGNAGMAHAAGQKKDANTHLRYYLDNNVNVA